MSCAWLATKSTAASPLAYSVTSIYLPIALRLFCKSLMHTPGTRNRGPYSSVVRIHLAPKLAVGKTKSTNPISMKLVIIYNILRSTLVVAIPTLHE